MDNIHFPTRALHLVDLENLLGAPGGPRWPVTDTVARFLVASGWVDGDHLVVAGPPQLIYEFKTTSHVPSQPLVASGPNAADLALIAAADPSFVARRFTRVVIGSGDGIFCTLVSELSRRGVSVSIVGRTGAISRRLIERATVIRLDGPLPQRAQATA